MPTLFGILQPFRFFGHFLFLLFQLFKRLLCFLLCIQRGVHFFFCCLLASFKRIQLLIFRQLILNRRDFPAQPVDVRPFCFCLLFLCFLLFFLFFQFFLAFLFQFQLVALFLNLFGLFISLSSRIPRLFPLADLIIRIPDPLVVFLHDVLGQFQRRFNRKVCRFGLLDCLQLFRKRRPLGGFHVFHRNQNFLARVFVIAFFIPACLAEPFRQIIVKFRLEYLSEDLFPLIRFHPKQLAEFPLCNHDNLRKLFRIHPNDFFLNQPIDLFEIRDCFAVWHVELHFGIGRIFILAQHLRRTAADGIYLSPASEYQFHKSLRILVRIIRAQVPSDSIHTASRAIQRKHNRVKDCRFSRSGLAGDGIQTRFAQPGHIQFLFACIGAESAHRQFDRFHACMPSTFFIVFSTNRTASSLISLF